MCGIVGYVGKKINIKNAILALKKLEYRGYDSSGIAYINKKQIESIKSVGGVDNLLSQQNNQTSRLCICHTRWATHGMVNQQNAHPQISAGGKYAVVHNGIIENYKQLISKYCLKSFKSQTDTEVVSNLLEYFDGSTIEKVTQTVNSLTGSFALAITDGSDKYLYVAKNKSPLYVAQVDGGYMVASDIVCFAGKSYYILSDGMVGKLSKNKVEFYVNGKLVNIEPVQNTLSDKEILLNGYSHFMQKEIAETQNVVNNIATRYQTIYQDMFKEDLFNGLQQIYLVGCGTAYHACQMGAIWLQESLNIKSEAYIASEFRYSNPIINSNCLVIFLSQSGETADTLACATMAKEQQAKIVAITNVEYSTLARMANMVFPLCAGPEIAVASTKAYSAMLVVLYILAKHKMGQAHIINNLKCLSQNLEINVDESVVEIIKQSKRVFFIGRNVDGITANEGALKLKEIAYLDAAGYYAGELKHGTIALIEPNVVVIAIITNQTIKEKTINAIEEVLSRGAKVIAVTDDINISGNFNTILLPSIDECELKNILAVIPLQKLAYSVACALGNNPDKPRNLAKSVTVE